MPMHSAMIEMIRPALLSDMPRPLRISCSIGAGASHANDCAVSSSSNRTSIIHLYGESLLIDSSRSRLSRVYRESRLLCHRKTSELLLAAGPSQVEKHAEAIDRRDQKKDRAE